jgi:hypothetical protein
MQLYETFIYLSHAVGKCVCCRWQRRTKQCDGVFYNTIWRLAEIFLTLVPNYQYMKLSHKKYDCIGCRFHAEQEGVCILKENTSTESRKLWTGRLRTASRTIQEFDEAEHDLDSPMKAKWPYCLWHLMKSCILWTLGSWVWIPFRMPYYFLLSCVGTGRVTLDFSFMAP